MTRQSRKGSLAEALTSTVLGFVVSVLAGMVVYPLFGWDAPLVANLGVVAVFTVLSILRGYVVRRGFEGWLRCRGTK